MLITIKHYGIPFQKYYFTAPSARVTLRNLLMPTAYMDCYSAQKPWLFRVEQRHTLLTDLLQDETTIFDSFPKDTRSQIRRYEQEQYFSINLHTQLTQFIPLYNAFAMERGLSHFSTQDAANIGQAFEFVQAFQCAEIEGRQGAQSDFAVLVVDVV